MSREAAACKGLRRTLFGRLRGRRTREWSWQPGGRSRHTLFRYDELNRVTELADARQGITRFSYDPNGNLLTVTDAKGQTTTYTYDQMDRQASRTDALGREETYQYDAAGNLSQFTDRTGQVSTFAYDALNRRTGAQYADGSTTTFTYDAVGRLAAAEESTAGRVAFTYDGLDRLVQEVTSQGAVAYTYDALGRRTQMTVNGAPPVTYQYDAASRLTQVAQADQFVGLAYDDAGRRTSLSYPNGTLTSYSYDDASRLTRLFHTGPAGLIEDLTYTYDAAGNRLSLTRATAQASLFPEPLQAAYDAANEQIQVNSPTPNQTFDANGNLTSQTDATGTTTYTWDARNRLIGLSGPGVTASFTYDALGRRVSKTVNGVTTDYLYDGNDIVAEIGGGAVGATYLRSLSIDEPFVLQTTSGNEYYHADALRSVLALTNDSGTVATTYTYEAFGKATIAGTSSNPFQFVGRENDATGLYDYRARYYGTRAQRFLSEDPVRLFGADLNYYSYARNNPLGASDPSGLLIGSLIQRGLDLVLKGGATAEEIALRGRLTDATIGAATTFGDVPPANVKGTPLPVVGGTVGDIVDTLSLVGGIQTTTLGTSLGTSGLPALGVGLAFVGGFEIGTAINNLYLNNPYLFPIGNPVHIAIEYYLGRRK